MGRIHQKMFIRWTFFSTRSVKLWNQFIKTCPSHEHLLAPGDEHLWPKDVHQMNIFWHPECQIKGRIHQKMFIRWTSFGSRRWTSWGQNMFIRWAFFGTRSVKRWGEFIKRCSSDEHFLAPGVSNYEINSSKHVHRMNIFWLPEMNIFGQKMCIRWTSFGTRSVKLRGEFIKRCSSDEHLLAPGDEHLWPKDVHQMNIFWDPDC